MHVHAYIYIHTHVLNKNDYPGEFVKRQTDPSENKTKIEEEKAKMPMKNLAANFPYDNSRRIAIKFQKIKSEKFQEKILNFFRFCF